MGAAFMVSYTRAKSEGLGFTPGTGMAAVGIMPARGPARDPEPRARPGRHLGPRADGGATHRRHPALGRSALGDHRSSARVITVIQRILHVRSQAKSATTTRSQLTEQRRQHVSNNGKQRQERQQRRHAVQHLGGRRPARDGKIRVAIVGVGNCASSLVQGRYYYENAKDDDFVPGLMHVNLGGYHVRDIEFVAAFDIDKNKVGKDLSEAIYTKPNNTYVFQQVAAASASRSSAA